MVAIFPHGGCVKYLYTPSLLDILDVEIISGGINFQCIVPRIHISPCFSVFCVDWYPPLIGNGNGREYWVYRDLGICEEDLWQY